MFDNEGGYGYRFFLSPEVIQGFFYSGKKDVLIHYGCY